MVRAVVDAGLSVATVARLYRTTPKTVSKGVARFCAEGVDGLRDRSSKPQSSPSQTPPTTCAAIEASRRQRHTGKQIAAEVGVSPATVSRVLRRLGLNALKALEPTEPVRRYERAHPGEMIHLDIKKLGRFEKVGHRITADRAGQSKSRGVGWEFVHVSIDDASRLAFSQILPDEKAASAVRFLKAAVAYYASLGVAVTRRYKVANANQPTQSIQGQPLEAPQLTSPNDRLLQNLTHRALRRRHPGATDL